MTTIFLDPDQVDATAGAISAHAAEVEGAARGLEDLGAIAVPPSLSGWLASELADIATTVRVSAVLYLVASIDVLARSQALRTNQSLVTVFSSVDAPAPVATASGCLPGQPSIGTAVALGAGQVLGRASGATPGAAVAGVRAIPGLALQVPGIASSSPAAPATSRGSRIVEENIMTTRLMNIERNTWTALNRSMSTF